MLMPLTAMDGELEHGIVVSVLVQCKDSQSV